METKQLLNVGFLRLHQVLALIPVSKSAWYAGMAEGRYPRPVQLGPRTVAYRVEDIATLIESLGAQVEQKAAQ